MEMYDKERRFRLAQKTLEWLSFIACVFPVVIYAILNCTVIKEAESRWALGGVAAFVIAVILLTVFRAYTHKYLKNIPCTLGILAIVVAMLLFVICLEKILDDVKALLLVESISASVGLVLELASVYCKSAADEAHEYYMHGVIKPKKSDIKAEREGKEGGNNV